MSLILELQEEIRLLKNGKKSNTSHTPPAQDLGRSNQKNSREKSGKKSGGQQGHKGSTLQMKVLPDEIIEHTPDFCTNCSNSLEGTSSILHERKQEVIIPPFQAKYVEHQSFMRVCTCCGYKTTGQLPQNIAAPIQYGESVAAAITYLSIYQYLPYNRIKKLMNDLFHLSISEGTVNNILEKMTQRALPMYQEIQSRISVSNLVGGDETGTKINTKKGWFHVWQNTKLTFIVSSLNRGYATVEEYFSDGFSNAVYVSDCWSSQLKIPAFKHQLCFAHLLRELKNFEETFDCEWSSAVKKLMQRAITLKNEMKSTDFETPCLEIAEIEDEFDELLKVDSSKFHKKQKAFIKRLVKNRQSIFVFLYHEPVPFDNNGSERAIRNVKVKNKISGCFRSENGAYSFAVLRSVIDTTIKNSQDVFTSIQLIASFRPE
ncbi:MAG: IS66 family transposase [Crocinitomicaceae bacterium]|nr:IS66 family transposase [Crocinitomicaceae bacterium]